MPQVCPAWCSNKLYTVKSLLGRHMLSVTGIRLQPFSLSIMIAGGIQFVGFHFPLKNLASKRRGTRDAYQDGSFSHRLLASHSWLLLSLLCILLFLGDICQMFLSLQVLLGLQSTRQCFPFLMLLQMEQMAHSKMKIKVLPWPHIASATGFHLLIHPLSTGW